jgi:glycosyltransferase involved in cell wall biosynthesis
LEGSSFGTMKKAKIVVLIPCFNHGEFLPEAVGSVLAAGRNDVELVVVDDGSTDERTRQEMDALCGRGIKVIRQENKGLAAARNAGIAASTAEFVFPLDADDRMRPGWIDRALAIFDSAPGTGVIYGDAQCFGVRTQLWRVGPFDQTRLLGWNYIHASALYRRAVWEANQGYDGTMPVQGLEDWDFWLGALEHSWKFAYLPEIFFDYRQHEESMATRTRAFEKAVSEFVARKHGVLYREAWVPLASEHESVKKTFRNLCRLIEVRVERRLRRSSSD